MKHVSTKHSCHKQVKHIHRAGRIMLPVHAIGRFLSTLARQVFRRRSTLNQLSDHELRDIGMSRERFTSSIQTTPDQYRDVGSLDSGLCDQRRSQIRRLPPD